MPRPRTCPGEISAAANLATEPRPDAALLALAVSRALSSVAVQSFKNVRWPLTWPSSHHVASSSRSRLTGSGSTLPAGATHYLFSALVQRLTHCPEVPLWWTCPQPLTVRTGEQIWGLLDVLPDTFDKIPETLDTASKTDTANRIEHAVTVYEWMERMADGQSEESTSL